MSPRYIPISDDDQFWLAACPPSELKTLLGDPTAWIREQVPNATPSMSGSYHIQMRDLPPGRGGLFVTGISGTEVIDIEGTDNIVEQLSSGYDLPPNRDLFWQHLDEVILQHRPEARLDFTLVPDIGRFYMHLEMIDSLEFGSILMAATARDQGRFVNWLTSLGPLHRVAHTLDEGGQLKEIPVSKIKVVPNGTTAGTVPLPLRLSFQFPPPGGVQASVEGQFASSFPPPDPVICFFGAGNITLFRQQDGTFVNELGQLTLKFWPVG